ncbi:MAG: phosphate ABC transporter ATP-binding protein [Hyphomicrobiales bacterium]
MLDIARSEKRTDSIGADAEPGGLLPVELDHVSFLANGRRLIDGVDLSIGGDGITLIMGPNGAGKSLLLRLMHGMIEPSSGTVRWGGRPIDENIRKRQAMVFQTPVLLRRSVAQNIAFVLNLRNAGAARTDEVLERAGLIEHAGKPARLLSGGERQRLAMARALATGPDVLFLDEPTASLDPASVAAIEDVVHKAHEAGTKIILITHDIGQARRLGDDVVFVHRGRIVEHSAADDFFGTPESAQARDYLAGRIVL